MENGVRRLRIRGMRKRKDNKREKGNLFLDQVSVKKKKFKR